MESKKIKIIKDWPYFVSGNIPLDKQIIWLWNDGEPHSYVDWEKFKTEENYALCRCWQSSNKPFCDWSHNLYWFAWTETASREKFIDQAEVIKWPTLDLLDNKVLCSLSRFCHPEGWTWNLTRDSWDMKSRIQAIKESFNCPSWRLVHIDKSTWETFEPTLEKSISLIEDPQAHSSWPIWVKWWIEIEFSDWEIPETRNRVTLCRCGKSSNKPYCDGTHIRAKFNDWDESLK